MAMLLALAGALAAAAPARATAPGPHPAAPTPVTAKPPAAAPPTSGPKPQLAAPPTSGPKPQLAAPPTSGPKPPAAAPPPTSGPKPPAAAAPSVSGPKPPATRVPDAALETLAPFIGAWTCTALWRVGPTREITVKAKLTVRRVLAGYWIESTYDAPRAQDFPGFRAVGYWGWEAASKRFVSVGFDSMGGSGTERAAAWQGDKLVWNGEGRSGGEGISTRTTFTRTGAASLRVLPEVRVKGAWVRMSEETCRK